MLYEDYNAQVEKLYNGTAKPISYAGILWCGGRLLFWATFIDVFLHYYHVAAFFVVSDYLRVMDTFEQFSVAYHNGLLFYLKYVVIFGISALLARTDGLTPPQSPMCISRISLYSNMWRYFDRGLYVFLTTQVYIPMQKIIEKHFPRRAQGPVAKIIGVLFAAKGHCMNHSQPSAAPTVLLSRGTASAVAICGGSRSMALKS